MSTKKPAKDPKPKAADATAAAAAAAAEADDTEGHSLLHAEFHRQVATSRSREASEWTKAEQARRQAKDKDKGRSSAR